MPATYSQKVQEENFFLLLKPFCKFYVVKTKKIN